MNWLPEFGISPIKLFTESILLECVLREYEDDEFVGPRLPPLDLRPGRAYGPVMLSGWWVDMEAAKNVGMDVAVAVAVYEITHSGGTAAAIAILRKLHSALKRLSKEELEVIRKMSKLSGGDIYEKRISESELLHCWPGESSKLLTIFNGWGYGLVTAGPLCAMPGHEVPRWWRADRG